MKQRTIVKIGVLISVILFGVGVGWFSFAKLNTIDQNKNLNLLSQVPANCIGLLETDNIDLVTGELTQAAYADQFKNLPNEGIWNTLQKEIQEYVADNVHGLSNHVNRLVVSFHSKEYSSHETVIYLRITESGKSIFKQILQKICITETAKKEIYRGKEIAIYPIKNKKFLATYEGSGFLVLSYQKRLLEKVIDSKLDNSSLLEDELFLKGYHGKESNFITVYGKTASVPLLSNNTSHCWSEYDLHLNSEVFYLSGGISELDSNIQQIENKIKYIPQIYGDSILVVSEQHRVDSCISSVIAQSNHSLFEECISNLSREASYIMVADMDKIIQNPKEYTNHLPSFLIDYAELFRSFILSVQVTKVNNKLSHIFVFTYKE